MEVIDKKKEKLDKYYNDLIKKREDKLLIARTTRKTIRYIERTIMSINNKYRVLKDKIKSFVGF